MRIDPMAEAGQADAHGDRQNQKQGNTNQKQKRDEPLEQKFANASLLGIQLDAPRAVEGRLQLLQGARRSQQQHQRADNPASAAMLRLAGVFQDRDHLLSAFGANRLFEMA